MARSFAKSFYNSKQWQAVRDACMKRDHYLCQICGAPAQEVHHKTKLSPHNINDPNVTLNADNLVSLCRDCHFIQHTKDKQAGIKKINNNNDCDNGMMFDSNGQLVKIAPPIFKKIGG